MARTLRKIIQLLLDPASARKAEQDVKQTASRMDRALGAIGKTIAGLGAALGIGYLVRKVTEFGKASIEEAAKSEKSWSRLAGTIEQLGGNFRAREKDIRAMADAFQRTTVHDDESFVDTFQRLAVISGDVDHALHNVGLTADVAAQFFGGELAPAAELVAKVLAGNTTQLGKMGIHVKTAQEGLELLAKRSFGAAAREARTFGGQLQSIGNAWGDFKKQLGAALIEGVKGTSVLDQVRGSLVKLADWVKDHGDDIAGFMRLVIRQAEGAAKTVGTLVNQFKTLANIITAPARLLGFGRKAPGETASPTPEPAPSPTPPPPPPPPDERAEKIKEAREDFQVTVRAAETQAALLGSRFDLVGAKIQATTTLLQKLATLGLKPSNAEMQEVAKSLEELTYQHQALEVELPTQDKLAAKLDLVDRKAEALGESFDPIAAKIAIVNEELEAAFGDDMSIADEWVQTLLTRLRELDAQMKERDGVKEFQTQMAGVRTELDIAAASFDEFGQPLDAATLAMERMELTARVLANTLRGLKRDSSDYEKTLSDLKRVQGALEKMQKEMKLIEVLGSFAGEAVGAALLGGLPELAKMKAKENALRALEQLAQGFVASFTFLGAPVAAKHFAAAKMYGALAAGWGGIGLATGGFSGGGSGGGAASATRANANAASRAEPSTEVHIYLTGPGFHAMNPKVQRVIWGAQQEARKRFGENAKIRVHTGG